MDGRPRDSGMPAGRTGLTRLKSARTEMAPSGVRSNRCCAAVSPTRAEPRVNEASLARRRQLVAQSCPQARNVLGGQPDLLQVGPRAANLFQVCQHVVHALFRALD